MSFPLSFRPQEFTVDGVRVCIGTKERPGSTNPSRRTLNRSLEDCSSSRSTSPTWATRSTLRPPGSTLAWAKTRGVSSLRPASTLSPVRFSFLASVVAPGVRVRVLFGWVFPKDLLLGCSGNFRRVKQGRMDDYQIKRYQDTVVADNFRHGADKNIVVALPDDV